MVCTGNVCRSPAAERLLAARVPAGVVVSSAGVRALTGYAIDGPTALVLRERGVDTEGHAGRLLTPTLLHDADLVLTAESGQRRTILEAEPTAMRTTFTIREFARLGAGLPAIDRPTEEALRRRVRDIAARRGVVPPAPAGGDDIGDPFGASVEVARETVTQLASAVDGVLAALGLG
jgi:protein-tyrosine phosphatase